jgi:hypothetical protein
MELDLDRADMHSKDAEDGRDASHFFGFLTTTWRPFVKQAAVSEKVMDSTIMSESEKWAANSQKSKAKRNVSSLCHVFEGHKDT